MEKVMYSLWQPEGQSVDYDVTVCDDRHLGATDRRSGLVSASSRAG